MRQAYAIGLIIRPTLSKNNHTQRQLLGVRRPGGVLV